MYTYIYICIYTYTYTYVGGCRVQDHRADDGADACGNRPGANPLRESSLLTTYWSESTYSPR